MQHNLQSDVQRRQKLAVSERRQRRLQQDEDSALPLIDPDEVRASLQQLHGKRDTAPPPPKPVVVLQPTPVMRTPSAAHRPDEQTRQRNAEALFGAGSRFAAAGKVSPEPAITPAITPANSSLPPAEPAPAAAALPATGNDMVAALLAGVAVVTTPAAMSPAAVPAHDGDSALLPASAGTARDDADGQACIGTAPQPEVTTEVADTGVPLAVAAHAAALDAAEKASVPEAAADIVWHLLADDEPAAEEAAPPAWCGS
ncbi:hypothetical protein ACFSQE_02365 [Vogesella fluminis]|uniref:hypothetical protein n=1 Tax=Vogesella fluminis TaxID=1069161 RepID=UPI003629E3D5